MRALFTITIFLGSALLFLVQPMIAKMILPTFGGSPSVWNASVVFFQATLLLGYAYAHWSFSSFGAKRQPFVHVFLLAAGLLTLPFVLPADFQVRVGIEPGLQVLVLLAIMVGLPFFAISAGAPLLQRWFAATDDPAAKNPYFLYSASNAGSMLALLAYPILLEPALRLSGQSAVWAAGYATLALLTAGSAWSLRSHLATRPERANISEVPAPTTWEKFRWIALSAVPASLLLGVTSFLTTNVAPVPLLWVVPLALYLLTFIIAFSGKNFVKGATLARFVPLLLAPLALAIVLRTGEPIELLSSFHLLTFFLAALACHTLLSESKPAPARLTEFFLYVSLGGVLGGAFNAFIAPVIFKTVFEYPLALAAVAMVLPRRNLDAPRLVPLDLAYPIMVGAIALITELWVRDSGINMVQWQRTLLTVGLPLIIAFLAVDRSLRFGLSLLAIFVVSDYVDYGHGTNVIHISRNFFGTHTVRKGFANPLTHTLIHGNTTHGQQNLAPDKRRTPLTYYHPTGPIGQVFTHFSGPKMKENVALVGLGVGSLAAYGEPGQKMTFYEIDPTIEHIARNEELFTFLADSQAEIDVVIGDARLKLQDAAPSSYGLIVLDAFTSDAIPVHLLTKEAFEMYESKLAPGGIIAVHISNRYLNLMPIVTKTADAAGMVAKHQGDYYFDEKLSDEGKTSSEWMILARSESDFGELTRLHPWVETDPEIEAPVWTDDFSNIVSAFFAKTPGED